MPSNTNRSWWITIKALNSTWNTKTSPFNKYNWNNYNMRRYTEGFLVVITFGILTWNWSSLISQRALRIYWSVVEEDCWISLRLFVDWSSLPIHILLSSDTTTLLSSLRDLKTVEIGVRWRFVFPDCEFSESVHSNLSWIDLVMIGGTDLVTIRVTFFWNWRLCEISELYS